MLLGSCKKSSIQDPAPILSFVTKPKYITANSTVNAGDTVRIAWSALMGGKPMRSCRILLNNLPYGGYNNGTTKDLGDNDQYAFTDSIKFIAVATGDYLIEVKSESNFNYATIRVIVPSGIKNYSNIELSAINPFFSSLDGSITTQNDFALKQQSIDVTFALMGDTSLYFVSSSNRQTLGFSDAPNGTKSFFKKDSLVNFENATARDINNINADNSSQQIGIESNKVYAFVNYKGKRGLIKVQQATKRDSLVEASVRFSIKMLL